MMAGARAWLHSCSLPDETVLSGDRQEEASGNLTWISPTAAQAEKLTPGDLAQWARAIADRRALQLKQLGCGAAFMRFYCWHDGLAGQLRTSAVRNDGHPLPFACMVSETEDIESVCVEFLRSYLPAPSQSESDVELADDDDLNVEPFYLRVWVTQIP